MRRQATTTRQTQLAALLAAVVAAQDSEPGGTRQPREGETDGWPETARAVRRREPGH
jgi:hypothetical protein